MKKFYIFFLATLLLTVGCSKDDNSSSDEEQMEDPINPDEYNIVNNGNGGVNSITEDANDTSGLQVVQAVPSVQNAEYSNNLPILLFFDDKLLVPSLDDNIEIKQNGNTIYGNVTINEGANGYAILTFTPYNAFEVGANIECVISEGVQDDSGNPLPGGPITLQFQTKASSNDSFDDNLGFENGSQGVEFLGDGAIMSGTQGCVSQTEGNSFAAITTGNALISSNSSIGDASSIMILGAVNTDFNSLSFQYNFLSTEFQEFVDSEFDDSVIITVVGPNGAKSDFITSVNTVGTEGNTDCVGFPGIPDDDDTAGATGWTTKNLSVGNIGSPAYIILTVTDVGDTAYSSVMVVDNISI